MSMQSASDVLDVMLGIERRKQDPFFEIPALRKVVDGLTEQLDRYENTGYFEVSRTAYIGHEPMLGAQRQFSIEHDELDIPNICHFDLIVPEIRKKIEFLERFRTHEEEEGDAKLATSYLAVLHQYLCNAQRSHRQRRCFA